MVQTQGSVDQLVIMESAVTGLAATSAAQHNEVTAQLANLQQQMSNELATLMQQLTNQMSNESATLKATLMQQMTKMSEQQKAIEVKLDQTLNSNSDHNNGEQVLGNGPELSSVGADAELQSGDHEEVSESYEYVNWDYTHDCSVKPKEAYVSLKDFDESVRRLAFDESESVKNKVVEMMKNAINVNRTTRFPTDGKYFNVNLTRCTAILRYLPYLGSTSIAATNCQSEMKSLLKFTIDAVDEMILNKRDGIYDVKSFEEKFKLKWANKRQAKLLNKNDKQLETEIKPWIKKIQQQSTEIEQLKSTIDQQNTAIEQLKSTIDQQNTAIEQLKSTIDQQNTAIEQLKSTIEQLKSAFEQQSMEVEPQTMEVEQQTNNVEQQKEPSDVVVTLPQEHNVYVNWDRTHDILQTHSYVDLRELYDIISNWVYKEPPVVQSYGGYDCTIGYSEIYTCNVNPLHQSITYLLQRPCNINKVTRFPANGQLHINVKSPVIQFHLDTILKYNGTNKEEFSSNLSRCQKAIDNAMATASELAEVHNCVSFEQKYKLDWVS